MHVTDKKSFPARPREPSSWISRRNHACTNRPALRVGLSELPSQPPKTSAAPLFKRKTAR